MTDGNLPDISVSLRIQDAQKEREFWRSPEYDRMVQTCFNVTSYLVPLLCCSILLRQLRSPQCWQLIVFEVLMAWFMCMPVWWRWKAKRVPRQHQRQWQEKLAITCRAITFVDVPFIFLMARDMASRKLLDELKSLTMYRVEHATSGYVTWLTAVQNACVSSGAAFIIYTGILVPTYFRQQLLLQVYLLAMLMVLHQPVGMYIFQNAGPPDNNQNLCHAIGGVSYVVQSLVVGPLSELADVLLTDTLPNICRKHHTIVVIAFAEMYVTYICLYLAYRLEWFSKMQYLKRLHNIARADPWPAAADLAMAACMWVLIWMLASTFPEQLLNISIPLASA